MIIKCRGEKFMKNYYSKVKKKSSEFRGLPMRKFSDPPRFLANYILEINTASWSVMKEATRKAVVWCKVTFQMFHFFGSVTNMKARIFFVTSRSSRCIGSLGISFNIYLINGGFQGYTDHDDEQHTAYF